MEDKEFILEAVQRLLPSTSWWGKSEIDKEHLANLEICADVLNIVFDKIADNYCCKRWGNYSAEKLSTTSKNIIENFVNDNSGIFFEVISKIVKLDLETIQDALENNELESDLSTALKKARAMDIYWKKVEYDAIEFETHRHDELNGLKKYNEYAKKKLTREEWNILVEVFALYD